MNRSISYMLIRGGSSKGIYLLKEDLPENEEERDEVILSLLGRDSRQIDGLGGANPLTSKVAVISSSAKEGVDVDFLFIQVVVGENRVDSSPNCGNILSGVGAYAIEKGLVKAEEGETRVRVNMINSNNVCELLIQTPGKKVLYSGDAKIDGVPGTSAPVICNYMDIAGSICGSLFPTGNKQDVVQNIPVTCIDNGMPVVLIRASDLGISGYESCEELSNNTQLRHTIENIRMEVGPKMNLGDVTNKVVPKMSIIAEPREGGNVCTRTFIPHNCHAAIGVLGAVSVATACLYEESVAKDIVTLPDGLNKNISVEHPSGEFSVELESELIEGELHVKKAGLLRTARLMAKGEAYIHDEVYESLTIKEKQS